MRQISQLKAALHCQASVCGSFIFLIIFQDKCLTRIMASVSLLEGAQVEYSASPLRLCMYIVLVGNGGGS